MKKTILFGILSLILLVSCVTIEKRSQEDILTSMCLQAEQKALSNFSINDVSQNFQYFEYKLDRNESNYLLCRYKNSNEDIATITMQISGLQ